MVAMAVMVVGCGRYRFESGESRDAGGCDGVECGCPLGFQDVDGQCVFETPPSDCAELGASMPSAPSGSYTIDPGGAGAVSTQCDLSSDGGGWTLVYDQDWARFGALRTTAAWDLVNPDGSVDGDYSILARLRDFGYSSFEFRYAFPFGPLPAGFVQWTQDANPYDVGDALGRANVVGLTSTLSGTPGGCGAFVGLGVSSRTGLARLDADEGGCWWFAVGVAGSHPTPVRGIPAYLQPREQTAHRVQLWVRSGAL